ncbi:unnamed protein product [Staurois parvus]|uniref:Uncharacterized protein n=1 Tax=Staurois parvus TaxID=386267 RepID=A0ABN9ALV7_9NEOB|nr:unnamed protein product [Staurois parvus]
MISALMIGAQQCHPQVPPTCAQQSPTCAQQCTHLCHSAVSHTCAQKCHLPVPSSATHLCPPPTTCAPTSAAHQCRPPVLPVSATSQCPAVVPVSAQQ